jgi:hypothetical protein
MTGKGGADTPEAEDDFRRSIGLGNYPLMIVDRDGKTVGAAVLRPFQTATGLKVVKIEPLLMTDLPAETEFYEWLAARPSPIDQADVLDVWQTCAHSGKGSDFGLQHSRTFQRLDRQSLDGVTVAPLPQGLWIAGPDDPGVSLDAWTQLHNQAFATEWRFTPATPLGMRAQVAGRGRLSRAAIDEAGAPVGLVLARLENRPHDTLLQPVANVTVVCTAPKRMREGIGQGLLTAVLASARLAGAKSATIRADLGSAFESFRMYARAGFRPSLDLCIWTKDYRPAPPESST